MSKLGGEGFGGIEDPRLSALQMDFEPRARAPSCRGGWRKEWGGGTTRRAPREMETAPSFQLQTGWTWGEPGDSDGRVCLQCGRPKFDPWVGKIPWRSGCQFQYSCLENPMDGGAWLATVHGVAKRRTRLSDFTFFLSLSEV